MRKIITTTFVTLDGVMQAPGGPEEDTTDGFKYGGWQMNWEEDKVAGEIINKLFSLPFELLLGRITYDIFASYWPHHPEITDIAKPFNSTKKYVVSHKSFEPSWNNSKVISKNVVAEIKKLKEMEGPNLWIWGSGNLIQTLLENNLIDQIQTFTYPITLGMGKKLFAKGTQPQHFKMVDSKITPTGIVFATYEPSTLLKKR